jgi:hypothetical protein
MNKKILCLQPAISIRWYCKRVKLIKRQNIFQGLAVYSQELLLFLKTRAKFSGTHSTAWVTVSVTSDFNMTWYIPCGQRLAFFKWVFTGLKVRGDSGGGSSPTFEMSSTTSDVSPSTSQDSPLTINHSPIIPLGSSPCMTTLIWTKTTLGIVFVSLCPRCKCYA